VISPIEPEDYLAARSKAGSNEQVTIKGISEEDLTPSEKAAVSGGPAVSGGRGCLGVIAVGVLVPASLVWIGNIILERMS